MTTIAHLTDFHLLEEDPGRRRGADRWRLAFLSFGRPTNAARRRRRALAALIEARRTAADHLVLTGDLTEDGIDAQFEVLAAVLDESGWAPKQVTLVPGNHDAYMYDDAWTRALAGPLKAFAPTSAPGATTSLPGAVVVAVSTAFRQPVARSAGVIGRPLLDQVSSLAAATRQTGAALVMAQHHPPRRHPIAGLQWVDGLINHAEVTSLLHAHDHIHVLHGHTHRASDAPVRAGASDRIFCAQALVDGESPLRLYHVRHGRLWADAAPAVTGAHALAMA